MVTTTEDKIKKLTEVLEKEISERKLAIHTISEKQEEQKKYVVNLIPDLKIHQNVIKAQVAKIEKIKTEILGYTLQSVTIVVGMLALILSITFFWFNISNLSDEMYRLFVAIIIFFGGILVLWFILWIRRG